MAKELDYKNPYQIEDYKDVLNLAWQWRSYWQPSKRQMQNGFHWYHKEVPIVTPKQVEPHVPSTATTLVNDAADHLAGNDPMFTVKAVRESVRADEDRQRVQTSLNSAFDIIGNSSGHPLHRTLSIHGSWSGMMAARIYVKEGWDIKNPTIHDIMWKPEDPRFVYPDPGTGGRKAVIIWQQRNVGLIRQEWPDWDGHWFPAAGNEGQTYASPYIDTNMSGSWSPERRRQNKPLNDNATVQWIEYWDEKYKCYIANGVPLFTEEYGSDLIEHDLGFCPFVIRAAGYGDDTGEAQHRYKSMLANVFSELDTEAQLITQLKWIVQETAWPVYLVPKDAEGEFDMTPGALNFIENAESIKAVRTLREDAIEPKSIMHLLEYIKNEIERATYPEILKGSAPSGIRAGYPIAILSSQAHLKFASPTDALKEMFKELGMKTMGVVANRFKVPLDVIEGYKLKPEDYDTYLGRVKVKLEPSLPQDLASKLPVLEFLYGSAKFPAMEVIRELGYENPEELMELRMAEDLQHDPRVIQVMVEHLVGDLSPEAAAAVLQVSEPNQEIQQLTQQLQEMQAQIQVIQAQSQLTQMQAPPAPPQPQGPPPGAPPAPPQALPPPTAPQPPQTVMGGPGGTNFGQNLGAPGQTNMAKQLINPNTQVAQIARQQMAMRELSNMNAQGTLYGAPGSGQP